MKKMAFALMIVGFCALLYGVFMDTSIDIGNGERIHNISLGNTRTSITMFGGFIFLGGIGIFTVFKLTQSKEEKESENHNIQKSKQKIIGVKKESIKKLIELKNIVFRIDSFIYLICLIFFISLLFFLFGKIGSPLRTLSPLVMLWSVLSVIILFIRKCRIEK